MPAPELSDDQLATELHLLAILIERHKALITIETPNGFADVVEVSDFSGELAPQITLKAWR